LWAKRIKTPVQTPNTEPDSEFTLFMRAYQDMVFTTAARLLGNPAQAEDIAQETFVRAYQHFSTLRLSATPGGWLRAVATNLSLNHLSRHRRRFRLFSELKTAAEPDAPEPDVAVPDAQFELLAADERGARVQAALANLPEHQRVPLVLFHFEELPYEDIARRLHVSLSKVKTDIRRARLALLPMLKGLDPAEGA
jgi:RNA polymerase sigma-70 factor (ECF subfamily)